MEHDIIREYPAIRYESRRYDVQDFEKYKEITKSIESYEKWKIGINYRTNRKITIGGKTHQQLGYDFYIKGDLFNKLHGINIELYLAQSEKLKKEILDYNSQVHSIICRINLLEKWNHFVEFEGVKYGIQKIYNKIHRENDCNGDINDTDVSVEECRECRGTTSFTEPCRCVYKQNIQCVKCGYKGEIV